jgi:hypothetical protein
MRRDKLAWQIGWNIQLLTIVYSVSPFIMYTILYFPAIKYCEEYFDHVKCHDFPHICLHLRDLYHGFMAQPTILPCKIKQRLRDTSILLPSYYY